MSMRSGSRAAAFFAVVLELAPVWLVAQATDRLRLQFDTAQVIAVLRLLADAGRPAELEDWQGLLATDGYRRLRARETGLQRPFTDAAFAAFIHSDSLRSRAGALRVALSQWERADLKAASARAFAYLPAKARITATVYVVIKPQTNSFVWEAATNPAIFLYLDPSQTAAQFANTVAHELHHIGYASVSGAFDSLITALPDSARAMAEWMGAFGEGFAMLAAAGGPSIHPHATSPADDRARWDADMAHFNTDVARLDEFFRSILHRRYPSADSVRSAGMSFFGIQGPWYTVGWRMAVTIERSLGRQELIRCMLDPHRLLTTYNRLAAQYNRTHADSLAEWSTEIVDALLPPQAR